MTWWKRIFALKRRPSSSYQVAFYLYSKDAKRGAEVREHNNGQIYYVEQEWVEGTTFRNRGTGQEIGPYRTTKEAESSAVASAWFVGL